MIETGFIIEYNYLTKCGFAKLYRKYNLCFQFFKLNSENNLDLFKGDIITFYQQISDTSNLLVTVICVQKSSNEQLYTFDKKRINNLLVANDINMVVKHILNRFDITHYSEKYRFIVSIDDTSKRKLILYYLNNDITNGDFLLKSFITNYVMAINISKILEDNLEVIYSDSQYTHTYGGRDYTDHHYEICYRSSFKYPLDMYLQSLYSTYQCFIIDGCSEYYSDYKDYHLIISNYIKEHQNEMELHCRLKTEEMRNEIISNYIQLEHIEQLYSHFRKDVFEFILEVNNCKNEVEDFWQYNTTIDFFKEFSLDENICNQYEFLSWLKNIKNLSLNDNKHLVFDSKTRTNLLLTPKKNQPRP